jgi:tRNA pseudouridine38-40 synthase
MKLLIKCSFDGSAYHGYQVQRGGAITIQSELNRACLELFGYECDVVGCSRTDAGVHARMFCAAISKRGQSDLPSSLPFSSLPRALNAHLPNDISVFEAISMREDAHPRYAVVTKEYEYRFLVREARDPFECGRSWHIPMPLFPDAVERMNRAAAHFCGRHDFSAFMAQGSKIVDAHRTVVSASVVKNGDILCFRVRADGFLYNMVRIMAGTLIECAMMNHPRDPDSIPALLDAGDRAAAGRTAPACGLYLDSVEYPKDIFL